MMESTPRDKEPARTTESAPQTSPSSAPAPASRAAEPVYRPPTLLRRVLGWGVLLVVGFGFASMLGYLQMYAQYYDTTGGVQEKYHSGEKWATKKIAIIDISGVIVDGEGFVQYQIEKVRQDSDVRAVVVRVNSPGGSVSGSDYIYHRLKELRDEKKIPLVVSMGDLAASGGYYVSMAVGGQEDAIFAEPTTTTGSIGVIMPHYDLSGLLKEKLDVEDDSIVSGPNKQILSMTRTMTPEQRQLVQDYVDAAFKRFKDVIKDGRPMFKKDPEALDQLATGEIFWAEKAQQHGLVDEIGFLDDAIDRAMELARLSKDETIVVTYKRQPGLFDDIPGIAGQSRALLAEQSLWEMGVPRAYYLFTTLPPFVVNRAAR